MDNSRNGDMDEMGRSSSLEIRKSLMSIDGDDFVDKVLKGGKTNYVIDDTQMTILVSSKKKKQIRI